MCEQLFGGGVLLHAAGIDHQDLGAQLEGLGDVVRYEDEGLATAAVDAQEFVCLLYTSPSPRDCS